MRGAPVPVPAPGHAGAGAADGRAADGGGNVESKGTALRDAGADGAPERAAGRGAAPGGTLAHTRHGEQPGPERGRRGGRRARRGFRGRAGLLGRRRGAAVRAFREPAGTAGVIVGVPGSVIGVPGAVVGVLGAIGVLGAVLVLGAGFPEGIVEGLLVQAGGVEGVAAAAVRQGQPGRGADVLLGHHVAAGPGGQRDRGPGGDQVGTHAVHAERPAHRADLAERGVRQVDVRQAVASRRDLRCQRGGVGGEAAGECGGAGLEGQPAADHLGPFGRVVAGRRLHGQAEPVEQLRAQLPFLRVHGADQQEPRGVPDRDPLALHVVDAQRGRVEQQVDQVVVEQVDLVDVEHPAVRRGEQPRLEGGGARGQHALDVERARQPVLGRPHRELGQGNGAQLGGGAVVRSGGTRGAGRRGIAGVGTPGDHGHRWQQRGQAAHHGRLGGALLPPDQDAADGR